MPKIDLLKLFAPKAAEKAVEEAKTEAGEDIAKQAAVAGLQKKEASEAESTQTPEATAGAEKAETAEVETSEDAVIDGDMLVAFLNELAEEVDALKGKKEVETKAADEAAVAEGFQAVQKSFDLISKERDEDRQRIAKIEETLVTLTKAVQVLTEGAPRSAQKAFTAAYRAAEASDTAVDPQVTAGLSVTGKGQDATGDDFWTFVMTGNAPQTPRV